jgi:hypothetical protein
MGDRVSQGLPNVQPDGLEAIVDADRFLARVAEIENSLVGEQPKRVVARFQAGMRRREEGSMAGFFRQFRKSPMD